MGMSLREYWDGPHYLTIFYKKAFRLKRELDNEYAWIQGIYFYDAVAVCLQNVLRKRGQKRENYFEKPFDIFPLTKTEKKRREWEETVKMQKALEQIRQQQVKRKSKKQGGE